MDLPTVWLNLHRAILKYRREAGDKRPECVAVKRLQGGAQVVNSADSKKAVRSNSI